MKGMCKFGYALLLVSGVSVGQSGNNSGFVLPADMMDPDVAATKAEYGACRNAVMRSCFAPSKCEASYMKAPCVKVVCAPVSLGKDKDGEDISARIAGYDGGDASSWDVGKILSADDYSGFRSETWEGAKSNPNRVNFCTIRFEALAFIWQYGTTADKALLKNVKTSSPVPAGVRPSAGTTPSSVAAASQSILSSCTDEIRRTQLESQSWTGNVDDVAARLGRFQKDLFEGRCSGHPEAQAYINGARKMLAYGGNPSGSSGGTLALPGRESAGGAEASVSAGRTPPQRANLPPEHNPVHVASDCIQIYNKNEMKARGLKTTMPSIMVNTCAFPISVQWCVEAGNGSAGDCNPGFSNLINLGAKATRGIDSNYQTVRYGACRHGKNMGFQRVEQDPRQPFRFSCS